MAIQDSLSVRGGGHGGHPVAGVVSSLKSTVMSWSFQVGAGERALRTM